MATRRKKKRRKLSKRQKLYNLLEWYRGPTEAKKLVNQLMKKKRGSKI